MTKHDQSTELLSVELTNYGSHWTLYLCYFDNEAEYNFDTLEAAAKFLMNISMVYR